ncbi:MULTISPECIES: SEL1-like repeat protein [Filomicrobium]|uniref:Localization factor PodJL n=1 Tax=Filomicrobium insigne TaxID=418854 RepID=A0A1H0HB30_9HYPH|nr:MULTISPECIES: SEL1-like repeat protein [Filomicrobium]MCV0367823.1 SEL1-like repeat protein [Filomicrobium sp.]SDO16365.1 localization factor PodJL [Filomicrobium insigne]
MSNREQRIPSPVNQQGGRSSTHPAGLTEELTAVLKLIATQNAKARDAEGRIPPSDKDERGSEGAAHAPAAWDHSSAIDRIQDEIGALSERFAGAGPDTAGFDEPLAQDNRQVAPKVAEPSADDEPWDLATAEALTRVYEVAALAGAPATHGDAITNHPAAVSDTTSETNRAKRDWLEERFAGIAAKLESSLADEHENKTVEHLDSRLEHLEIRICKALEGLVTRSDIEHLRPASAQFETVADHLDRTTVQLSRLDTIEGNLKAILDRLANERFDNEGAVASEPVDIQAVADATANNIVARLSDMGLGHVNSKELAEIRQSIDLLIEERRRHDEEAVTILDTLQQAMIGVIDRVDALAQLQNTIAEFEDPLPAYPDKLMDGDEDAQYGEAAGMVDPYAAMPERESDLSHSANSLHAASSFTDVPMQQASSASQERLPSQSGPHTFEDADDTRFSDAAPSDVSPVDRIRQELIADAKRARQQASEQASKSTMAGIVDKIQKTANARIKRGDGDKHEANAKLAAPKAVKRSKKPASAAASGALFGRRRKLLVGAVIILFATAGALMMLRATKTDAPKAPAVSIEQNTGSALFSAPEASALNESDLETDRAQHELESPASVPGQTGELETAPLEYDGLAADPARPVASSLHGIKIQNSARALTPDQMAQLDEKRAMAQLSTKLGEAAAHAVPAALFPGSGTSTAAVAPITKAQTANASGGMVKRTPLNLPPATVGPMSLRMAAANGDASAEFEVGARLAEGNGTDQNFEEAARWYQRSAAQGFAQAQYRLGTFYERGLGMKKDLARAQIWYQRAAETGNIKAMHNLAVLSTGGDTGTPDYKTAAKWFSEAAERGLSDSQYNLAVLHENGLGTEKDLRLAYLYFSLAEKSGDGEAKRRLEILRPQLSPDQLEVAEGMVKSWRRKPTDRLANDARAAGEDWKSRADVGYGG